MNYEETDADLTLTPDQVFLISKLSIEELAEIDKEILSITGNQYLKISYVVGTVMSKSALRLKGIPDVFYSQRIAGLVASGDLVAQGDLARMRYCEIKLP